MLVFRASMSARVYLLNGPNLELLGEREPDIYGRSSLADVETLCRSTPARLGILVSFSR